VTGKTAKDQKPLQGAGEEKGSLPGSRELVWPARRCVGEEKLGAKDGVRSGGATKDRKESLFS